MRVKTFFGARKSGHPAKGHWSENWPKHAKGLTAGERFSANFLDLTVKVLHKVTHPSWPIGSGADDDLDKETFDELTPSLDSYQEAAKRLAVRVAALEPRKRLIVVTVRHSVAKAFEYAGKERFSVTSGRRHRDVLVRRDILGNMLGRGFTLRNGTVFVGVKELDVLQCYARTKTSKYYEETLLCEYALPPQLEGLPESVEKESKSETYRAFRKLGKSPRESLEAVELAYCKPS